MNSFSKLSVETYILIRFSRTIQKVHSVMDNLWQAAAAIEAARSSKVNFTTLFFVRCSKA